MSKFWMPPRNSTELLPRPDHLKPPKIWVSNLAYNLESWNLNLFFTKHFFGFLFVSMSRLKKSVVGQCIFFLLVLSIKKILLKISVEKVRRFRIQDLRFYLMGRSYDFAYIPQNCFNFNSLLWFFRKTLDCQRSTVKSRVSARLI